MKPTKQVGKNVETNMLLRKGEVADEDLVAFRNNELCTYTSRWKLTFKERLQVFFGGSIWLSLVGMGHPPVRLDVVEPTDMWEDVSDIKLNEWRKNNNG